jgi:hypothetical protein
VHFADRLLICEDVITAPSPPTLLSKTMASPSLLDHLVTAKFDDGIPPVGVKYRAGVR